MDFKFSGSPSFRLFLTDLAPIAKRLGIDVWKNALALGLTALASEDLRVVIVNHLGTIVGVGFTAMVGAVVSGRLVKDNTHD